MFHRARTTTSTTLSSSNSSTRESEIISTLIGYGTSTKLLQMDRKNSTISISNQSTTGTRDLQLTHHPRRNICKTLLKMDLLRTSTLCIARTIIIGILSRENTLINLLIMCTRAFYSRQSIKCRWSSTIMVRATSMLGRVHLLRLRRSSKPD